jgi:hypothetical protein
MFSTLGKLHPARERYVTASQFDIVCHGSEQERFRLWQECIGEVAHEDLSDSLPVQLGKHCETFILDWQERALRQEITERQRFIIHPTLPFAATLDGYRAHDDAVVDAKTCNPFRDRRDIIIQHTPQIVIQMQCRCAARGILAVLRGFNLEEFEVAIDASYVREVIERGLAFHRCVETMTPPHALPEKKLVPPELWRTVDLATTVPLPNWGAPMIASLRQWSDTRDAVKLHDQSKTDVKAMLPDDVGAVLFGDLSVRRSKNGAVTIRERELAL